jgi:hypothetical protein
VDQYAIRAPSLVDRTVRYIRVNRMRHVVDVHPPTVTLVAYLQHLLTNGNHG